MMTTRFDQAEFNERLFFPRPEASAPPMGAHDFFIEVGEGASLHARWHKTQTPRALLLVFHGNGEVVADYDDLALLAHARLGADVVVVDYRGYGRSTGKPTFRGMIEDAPKVLDAVEARMLSEGRGKRVPLIVLGRSLGGHCATEIGSINPPRVDGIVLECAGSDLVSMLHRRGMTDAVALTEEERQAFDPGLKLKRCAIPTLLLHGEEDRVISVEEARGNLASIAPHLGSLVTFVGRGHNDLWSARGYWRTLTEFVDRVERERAAAGR